VGVVERISVCGSFVRDVRAIVCGREEESWTWLVENETARKDSVLRGGRWGLIGRQTLTLRSDWVLITKAEVMAVLRKAGCLMSLGSGNAVDEA
jgi:hypothetical protein